MDWLVLHMTCKHMLFVCKIKTGWIWEGQAHVLSNFELWTHVQNHILAYASFLVPHRASLNKLYVWFALCADVLLSQYLEYAAAFWGLVYVWLIWLIKLYAIKFYPYWYLFTCKFIVYFIAPTVQALAFIFCVWKWTRHVSNKFLIWCLWIRASQYNSQKIRQDATVYQTLLVRIYMKLNIFWATHRPSSEA
jgi:hypothetical protein